jgi:hypothetical protein
LVSCWRVARHRKKPQRWMTKTAEAKGFGPEQLSMTSVERLWMPHGSSKM